MSTRSLKASQESSRLTKRAVGWESNASVSTGFALVLTSALPLDACREFYRAAIALRNFLQDLGLNSWIKTSGSKGFHVVVPLDRQCDYSEVASFAHRVGRVLVSRHPNQLTLEFAKADRSGRILMDTGRNEYSATLAAVYAVRPRQGAPVSAPCTWHEVESGAVGPQTITLRDIQKRIADVGELWAEMLKEKQSLLSAIEQLKGCESAH